MGVKLCRDVQLDAPDLLSEVLECVHEEYGLGTRKVRCMLAILVLRLGTKVLDLVLRYYPAY